MYESTQKATLNWSFGSLLLFFCFPGQTYSEKEAKTKIGQIFHIFCIFYIWMQYKNRPYRSKWNILKIVKKKKEKKIIWIKKNLSNQEFLIYERKSTDLYIFS